MSKSVVEVDKSGVTDWFIVTLEDGNIVSQRATPCTVTDPRPNEMALEAGLIRVCKYVIELEAELKRIRK